MWRTYPYLLWLPLHYYCVHIMDRQLFVQELRYSIKLNRILEQRKLKICLIHALAVVPTCWTIWGVVCSEVNYYNICYCVCVPVWLTTVAGMCSQCSLFLVTHTFSGWSYVKPSHTLPAPRSSSSSLSSSALPSYRSATTNSTVVTGGDGPALARTPVQGTVLGRLKRSLSLTRLTKKRSRSRISQTDDESAMGDVSSPLPGHKSS